MIMYNGMASNSGFGSVARNTGKVFGVFGTLDWEDKRRSTLGLSSLQQGATFSNSFQSSVDVQNLLRLELHLQTLQSPQWPEDLLGKIDKDRANRGKRIFNSYCISCHDTVDRADPDRHVIATMVGVNIVGTDPSMANNSIAFQGNSGILRYQHVDLGEGYFLLNKKAPAVTLLTKASLNTMTTPDPDRSFIQRWFHWITNVAQADYSIQIQRTFKQGIYDSDTAGNPVASLRSYKARPLNGVWATAPYLHNGSVPTLYDLLLPKKREGDPDDGEYRPDQFKVGSRELDSDKVGLKSGDKGFTFDTSFRGNSNAGHEYASGKAAQPNGMILIPLSKEERLDLLEYLKTL